jgi:hypothetical protein
VTRHLAAFLASHARATRLALGDRAPQDDRLPVPDAVLLNGGVFGSVSLSQRLLEVLAAWRGEALVQLRNDHPDLAVARGAVAYALARHGHGPRIGGGSARSFFLLLAGEPGQPQQGVCLLPRGTEEGQPIRLAGRVFSLRLGQPVRFHLMASTGDLTYAPGELVAVDHDRFRPLPPLATVLQGADNGGGQTREVPVQLAAMVTEVGTLEIDCVATEDAPMAPGGQWRLEFQLRGPTAEQAAAAPADLHPAFPQAAALVHRLFGPSAPDVGPADAKRLQPELERLLGPRDAWDTRLLREVYGTLWDGARRRRRSADHERVWFNLVGYCLRPGYGFPLDDWRVQQIAPLYDQGVQYAGEVRNWAEWWTLWRRVAGGLDEGLQLRILRDVGGHLRPGARRAAGGLRTVGYDDRVRLVGALERLPVERKVEVGGWLARAGRSKPTESPQRWWALGRLGARVPLYGSAHHVVPREVAREWLEQVLALDWRAVGPAAFAAAQLARLSGDRDRDLEVEVREGVVQRLRKHRAPLEWVRMVQEVTELDTADQTRVFGESLPPGLRLVR